jgi:hypothetical protein
VLHTASDTAALALGSKTPKSSPTTVTELPPLTALFSSPYDTTAASKLKTGADVPAMPPMLTADSPYIVPIELLMQAIVVADVQDDVSHAAISSALVAVGSPTPKSSPATVTELPPLGAELRAAPEATAASKLKTGPDVPATPPTLTADSPNIMLIELLKHERVVADVHDDVPQATISSALVAVGSPTPKSSPTTVTELPPLGAELRAAPEATAASKLKTGADVPATEPTLTVESPNIVRMELLKQEIVVAEVHDDVPHTAISSALVAVCSPTPKSSPETVSELPPLGAAFKAASDATAASKLKTGLDVPATPPTLTADR